MSWIYAIGARDGSTVKIGYGHPAKRLNTARVWSHEDLRVLAKKGVPVGRAKYIEKRIHVGLAKFKVQREWFRRGDEVDRFLRVMKRARIPEFEIYIARLLREERCHRCEECIDLEAPILREEYSSGRRWQLCDYCYLWWTASETLRNIARQIEQQMTKSCDD